MADLLGAAGPEEIVIGPNMTTLTYHCRARSAAAFRPATRSS
jgi:hypothetical protein